MLVEGESIEEHACSEDGDVPEDGDTNEVYDMEHEDEHEQGMGGRPTRSRSPPRAPFPQQPAAMVYGGVLYMPDEQILTERALRRHRRLMARVDSGRENLPDHQVKMALLCHQMPSSHVVPGQCHLQLLSRICCLNRLKMT